MADSKISALPASSTPLAGTEVLPIVQSSATVKVAVSDLTAGRAVSAASLSLTTTPLAVASGGTGLATVTANNIPYGNGTSALSTDANFQFNSSSNLLVGTSSALSQVAKGTFVSSSNAFVAQCGNAATAYQSTNTSGTSAYYAAIFSNNGNTFSTCGTIEVNGSNTSYNTSSDYRLKEDVQPMTGALAKVALLKPVTYKWKSGGSGGEGFIAHELAEVCPQAVSGEKDGLKADGSIMPQGIDTSFLVATLTAAIQEQQALIESLTARLTALENK